MKTNFLDRIQQLEYSHGIELACAMEGISIERYYIVLWQSRYHPYFQNIFSYGRSTRVGARVA